MVFTFTMPTKLKFGENAYLEALPDLVSYYDCQKLLFLTGSRGISTIPKFIGMEELDYQYISIKNEPSEADVLEALRFSRTFKPDLIVSVGGGSVIDVGKTISYLANDDRELAFFFKNPYIEKRGIPHIAVPTTCGTCSEATANVVINRSGKKISLRAESIRPTVAILDPYFTKALPKSVFLYSSLDSLTQLIESYVSKKATSLTDMYCKEGLFLFQKSFRVDSSGQLSSEDRLNLLLAAYYSGVSLSNSKLGIIHGLASVIGGRKVIPHGLICGQLLHSFTELNISILTRQNDYSILERYKKISEILNNSSNSTIDDLLDLLKTYESALKKDGKELMECKNDLSTIIKESLKASSTLGNPVKLNAEQIEQTFNSIYK